MQFSFRQPLHLLSKTGHRRLTLMSVTVGLAIAVACGSGDSSSSEPTSSTDTPRTETPTSSQADPTATPGDSGSADNGPGSGVTDPLFVSPTGFADLENLEGLELSAARRWQLSFNWFTDFNQRTVSLTEIDNLLPRDRIKPVDFPEFANSLEAPSYMRDREPVIAIEINGDARAYPLAILMWQEIVNDTVGGEPITVTFCPLCNTAIAFERVLEGHELTFGTSGNLRNSDLVMWDRQTESWWQQITGEAIVGQLSGKVLEQIPSPIIAWEAFRDQYPDGQVLLREVNALGQEIRPFDDPPYAGYDSVDNDPFAFDGPTDDRLPANLRVLTVKLDDETVAYPFTFLEENLVINDTIGETDVVAFFDNGTLSAFLDARSSAQTSGSTTMFSRVVDGETLTFLLGETGIVDEQTGSVWNIVGKATSGPMDGKELEPVIHQNHFWFAWAVFEPDTEIRGTVDDVIGPVSAAP